MSRAKVFTATMASNNSIKVYDAMTGSIHRIVTLPGGSQIVSGPVVFGDGFSVSVKQGASTWMITYGFPLCNLKTKTHVSG